MTATQKQLAVRWRYSGGRGALIWQLMFTGSGDLIGLKRFTASRSALLFSIDPETGKVYCDDCKLVDSLNPVTEGESWFTGLETTTRDLVYCHLYQPDSPEHQGIWALDPKSGLVVWSRRDIIYAGNLDHEFLVYRLSVFAGFPERHFILIDPLSGKDIRQLGVDSLSINAYRTQFVAEEKRQQVILPEFVTEGMAVELLALQRAGVSDIIRIECIVQGQLTFTAMHEPAAAPGLWNSALKVWRDDRLVYCDLMEEGLDRPRFNNFLIRGAHLYYIKNKEELVCVALS
jgi:hypothetical protein